MFGLKENITLNAESPNTSVYQALDWRKAFKVPVLIDRQRAHSLQGLAVMFLRHCIAGICL